MVNRKARAASIDTAEVERFSQLASTWWDARGPMAALHKLNPVRLGYIRDKAAARFDRDPKKLDCLKGLRMLDIGCGGGILSEPLTRLGAAVTGIKAALQAGGHIKGTVTSKSSGLSLSGVEVSVDPNTATIPISFTIPVVNYQVNSSIAPTDFCLCTAGNTSAC